MCIKPSFPPFDRLCTKSRQITIRQAGCKVDTAGMKKQRGVSLIELIMFILIVSVAMIGILLVMNVVAKNNADPVMHKQALAIAESMLEEIELQNFTKPTGGYAGPFTAVNRYQFDTITDYNNYNKTGIVAPDVGMSAIPGLTGYSVTVTAPVTLSAWNGIPAGSWIMITVTVTPPSGDTITSVGYRTAY